ncbi:MAG: hypothetical protein F6K11_33100 [Leptolyngbya sp. SIO3F4]|nr:hypothetical protein [Leptolyngbya sp. SIO3F4]
MNESQTNPEKKQKFTIFLAFLGALQPTPVPFAGIHKFYLGQYGWGLVYILLGATQVPRIACATEGMWYLAGPWLQKIWKSLDSSLMPETSVGASVGETVDAVAKSLREIEHLRREGLLSEYEFEQKRRSLLEQIP